MKQNINLSNAKDTAKRLSEISGIADNSFLGGIINKDQHREIKSKARDLELDNLFRAMAAFCK